MRTSMRVAAMAVSLGVAACGDGTGAQNGTVGNQANAAGIEAGNAATAAKPAAAPALNAAGPSATASSPSGEIRALLIGKWTDAGDCPSATEIRTDGSFASGSAGDGRWELSNEYLTLAGSRATIELAVQEIDGNSMTTINPQGRIGRWTRC